jgi:hypothetical protein
VGIEAKLREPLRDLFLFLGVSQVAGRKQDNQVFASTMPHLKVVGGSVKHLAVKSQPVGDEGEEVDDKTAEATFVVVQI